MGEDVHIQQNGFGGRHLANFARATDADVSDVQQADHDDNIRRHSHTLHMTHSYRVLMRPHNKEIQDRNSTRSTRVARTSIALTICTPEKP